MSCYVRAAALANVGYLTLGGATLDESVVFFHLKPDGTAGLVSSDGGWHSGWEESPQPTQGMGLARACSHTGHRRVPPQPTPGMCHGPCGRPHMAHGPTLGPTLGPTHATGMVRVRVRVRPPCWAAGTR